MAVEDGVLATLDEYAEAYCAKDVNRLMTLFDDGDDISVIGTGEDELCTGPESIRSLFERNFAEATATGFEWHWTQVAVRDRTATVDRPHVDGEPVRVPLRWTVALRRTNDGTWRWLHRHASSAAQSQAEGTAYPTN